MARCWLSMRPPDAHEVAGGELEVAAFDAGFDGDAAAAGFPADGARAEGLGDGGELVEGDAGAVVAVDEQGADGFHVVAGVVLQSHDEVVVALAAQTVEASSPTMPMRTASMMSPGVRPTRAVAARLTSIRSCGRPVMRSARRSALPSTRAIMALAWSACAASGSSVRSARPVRRTTSSTSGMPRKKSSTRWLRRSTSSSEASAGRTVCTRKAPSSSSGMKSLPRAKANASAEMVMASVRMHETRVGHAPVEQRGVAPFDGADDPDVFFFPFGTRAKDGSGSDGDEGQREHERGRHGRDDGGGELLVHASFDAGHSEERREDGDDDERGEGDGPADCAGRGQRRLHPVHIARLGEPVDDVLGDDDGGVVEQAYGDGQAAEGHGVEADVRLAEEDAGEADRQRDGERDDEGRAEVAEEREEDQDDEERAEQHGAADAGE